MIAQNGDRKNSINANRSILYLQFARPPEVAPEGDIGYASGAVPKVSPEHLAARRRGILKAAFRCFSRQGLHATTMRDICRAANLSPGAIYSYFAGKQAIVEALARDSRERIVAFLDAVPEAADPHETVGRKLAALLAALETPEAADRIRLDVALWAEALREPSVRELFGEATDGLVASLAGGLEGVGAEEAEALGRVVLALFEGLALQKAVDPGADLSAAAAVAGRILRRPGPP